MKYFAFGSNMSSRRLRQRTPSAQVLGTYSLPRHTLRFHKLGMDGSGKCDAYFTGKQSDIVLGVLYDIDEREKPALDRAEGLGCGYSQKHVQVMSTAGDGETSVIYCATNIDDSLCPFTWYKEHVLMGAREAKLPAEYIAGIEAIKAVRDPDLTREQQQSAIYR